MTYDAEVAADTPYLYWKLNETSGTTATDSSGNARNGTYTGNYTLSNFSLNSALGSSSVFLNPTLTTGYVGRDVADFPSGSNLTFEIWFRHTDSAALSTDALISVSGATHTNAVLIAITDPNSPRLTIANNINTLYNATGSMDAMRYCHLVCTWVRATGAFEIWINGGLSQTGTLSAGATLDTNVSIVIGQDNNGTPGSPSLVAGSHWSGVLQAFAIYPSVLSQSRILAHYYAGAEQEVEPVDPMLPAYDAAWPQIPSPPPYINIVMDTMAGCHVTWRTYDRDISGVSYPGPGTWGVHTSDYRVIYTQ